MNLNILHCRELKVENSICFKSYIKSGDLTADGRESFEKKEDKMVDTITHRSFKLENWNKKLVVLVQRLVKYLAVLENMHFYGNSIKAKYKFR